MTESPRVSVIIPCYNAERFVGAAIESALAQTHPYTEVIVIDDGSTDGSPDVIRSFGDRIRHETGPNRGGCPARNRGLELATGEFIQFLDADDLLHPEKLERQLPLVAENENCLAFCDGVVFDVELDQQLDRYARTLLPADDPVEFMANGGLHTAAPLHWRKNLIAVGGFREELPCSQERDLHLRLACAGLEFRHLPESLFTVRRVEGSVSSDSTRVLDQHSGMVWRAHDILKSHDRLTDARAAALAGLLAHDARAYLNLGLPDKSRDYFEQAVKLHPDGGIPQAYSGKTRLLYHLVGPACTQRLTSIKRKLTAQP